MISQELTLTTSRFDAALDRVTREVEAKSQRMRRSFQGAGSGSGGMGGLLGGLGGGIAGAGTDLLGAIGLGGGLTGMAMLGKQALSHADNIADLTLALNDNAESLQRVDYAGQLAAGQGVQEIASAMLKLERALGQVENKKAAEALQNLGLNVEELQSMSLDEKILALSGAFQKARASGTGLADIQALLGRSASELIPLFEQGDAALRAMFEAAPVVADGTIQKMAEINDKFDAMILKAKSFTVEMVGSLAGLNLFVGEFGAALLQGRGIEDAFNRALLNQASRDTAGLQDVAERERKREENAKAQEDARAAAAKEADRAEAMKEVEKNQKRFEANRKAWMAMAEKTRAEEQAKLEDYQQQKFEQLTPKEQILALATRIEKNLGQSLTDPTKIMAGADALAAMGDFAAAKQVRSDLSDMMKLSERVNGMARVGAAEQGSIATLMDQIFGRGVPEQQLVEQREIAMNARDSKRLLGEILVKMDNPPTDRFSDFGR